jgi:[glutamine synthetase] adenylyltransferase / [glutamine synthetase]-adenylyl-L-tyrosine phosphorylase
MNEEAPKTGQTLSALAHFGFSDLSNSAQLLDDLENLTGIEASELLKALSQTANPDQALRLAINLVEAGIGIQLLKQADSRLRLLRLVGASKALFEFIHRVPEALESLEAEAALPSRATVEAFLYRPVQEQLSAENTVSAVTELRRGYRKLLTQISDYDLCAQDPLEVMQPLSKALAELAADALECGLSIARAELTLSQEHGRFEAEEIENTLLAVIGMGKGGAAELNYISDVDVIFVAKSNSDSLSDERMLEIATKLATRMMRSMDQVNVEPGLWQVDANLRPEGKSGALVRTLGSHLAYYNKWADNWEFQALLKANSMAGDKELAAEFVAAVQDLVWASSQRENFVESVQKMRERVSENIPLEEVDYQIKLGSGGLRDIEFTVQLLQLVHGRADSSVHARDTLSAFEELSAGGYIGRTEAQEFSKHYRFLRVLEHRIQLLNLRRTHLMPKSADVQRAIARSINLDWSAEDLMQTWLKVKQEVRALHQRIFYRPLLISVSKSDGGLILSSNQVLDRLAAIGFRDPVRASQHIEALTSGLSRRAQIQRSLLPVLLEWFGTGIDPDNALVAFRRLSENLGESHWYLRMLRDSSGAAERLTQVLANSKFATNLFELVPEAAAWLEDSASLQPKTELELASEAQSIHARHASLEEFANSVRNIRRREMLRLVIGSVLSETQLEQVSQGLSHLTSWYLKTLTSAIVSDLGSPLIDFGIVAMGRFGGEELDFASDADLMFTYRPLETPNEIAQKKAEEVVRLLGKYSKDQQLEFEMDLGLRPEGKNGPVARSMDSYTAYYARWSDAWENQALLRARVIYGSNQLVSDFTELANKYRYPENLDVRVVTEIRRIKARVENERLPMGADPKRHLKLGRGTLSDVEWLVQLLQLKYGNQHRSIRTPKTLEALDNLVAEKLLEPSDARVLKESWILCSKLRATIVLCFGKRNDLLPTARNDIQAIGRSMGYPRSLATEIEESYLAHTRRARLVFERVFFE